VASVKVTLYTIYGSHPNNAVMLMLQRKGIPFRRVILPPGYSRRLVRLFGFEGDRTPAMKIDGRRVQGSTVISRELDRIKPDPPLFPADPERRRKVEEAEAWGDRELQDIPRVISWWVFKRDRTGMRNILQNAPSGARLGLPAGLAVKTARPMINLGAKLNEATDEHVRALLARLPAALDQIDGWIAEGVLDGEERNAADYQIAASVRLLMAFEDLEPAITSRPAGALARRVLPEEKGRIPPAFPQEWLSGLQAKAAA
jgi:glutathione S-transferase